MLKKELINTKAPSISDIEMMYQIIIIKHPKFINDYEKAYITINKEFDVNITSRDLEASLDVTIETETEDLKLIYNNIK